MSDTNLTDLTIATFESGEINAEAFNHEAHIYVAWLYLEAYPVSEALSRFTAALKRLTLRLGVPEKYHHTITWFFMLLIDERRAPGSAWPAFRRANADLFSRSDTVLARYYRPGTLASDKARTSFLLPDALAA